VHGAVKDQLRGRQRYEFTALAYAGQPQHVPYVRIHGVYADAEHLGDVPARQTLSDRRQHVDLASGEVFGIAAGLVMF